MVPPAIEDFKEILPAQTYDELRKEILHIQSIYEELTYRKKFWRNKLHQELLEEGMTEFFAGLKLISFDILTWPPETFNLAYPNKTI